MNIQELKNYIDTQSTFAILVHRNPDGDCLGWGLGLWTLLEQQWKTVRYFCPTPPSSQFWFLPRIQQIHTEFDYASYDSIFCIDSADPFAMLGKFFEGQDDYFSTQHIINIDHHQSNTAYGNLNIIDDNASSVCELLTEIIEELYPDELTKKIATYLFMGLSTDTGHFMYDTDSIRTYTAALKLLKSWADKQTITQKLYRSKSFDQMRAIGLLWKRMKKEWIVIYSRYTKEDLTELHLDKEEIETFLHLMSSIEHNGIFALFKTSWFDLNPMLRCSLRANTPQQDVSSIASLFGWWWHKAAAGCAVLIEKDRESTMQSMIKLMNGQI